MSLWTLAGTCPGQNTATIPANASRDPVQGHNPAFRGGVPHWLQRVPRTGSFGPVWMSSLGATCGEGASVPNAGG
ncbi:hypothetical protein H0H93_016329 [Arthromyces matolae]|nr:hypothetical protein H0H93_016329 [Arthromyces matolae]